MSKRVSVIIPCYNAGHTIGRTLESVFAQDYPDVELVVVDDGSTDESKSVIYQWMERFEERSWCLKYVHQENQGPGAAISLGLKHITGAYLTLLDADDVFLPGSIRKRAEFLDTHPDHAGVRSNGWAERNGERQLFINTEEEKAITDLFTTISFGRTNNWSGTYMVRTDILFGFYPDRNIYPSRFGQNFQILLPVAYKRKFGYIDEPLMVYYLQVKSHSQAGSPEKQYELSSRNAEGYRDIYMHILDDLVSDPQEHQYYVNIFNSRFYRGLMERAALYNKPDDLTAGYRQLCATGWATLDDRITYYRKKNRAVVFCLRLVRKTKSLLGRR